MDECDENRRIFEYYVIAGLGDAPEQLTPGAAECGRRSGSKAPITDIMVIFPSLGETVPDGYTCIETTPGGHPADMNSGSLRTASCYLCYRRGSHKPPLVDIGVLYEGKGERVMVDSQIVKQTPLGRSANVNNATMFTNLKMPTIDIDLLDMDYLDSEEFADLPPQGIYLTYRRAADNAPPNQLAVTEICLIIASKGEKAPHTFCKVPKNLNSGMVGSDVFICYKKSQAVGNRLAYKPVVLDRFPLTNEPDFPMPQAVPQFCLPMGAVIECWPAKCQTPNRVFSTFVLTDELARKYYGACVWFYEKYTAELTNDQLKQFGLDQDQQTGGGSAADNSSTNDPAELMTFQANKAICVVSRYPFFQSFKRFLFHIYRMSISGHEHPLPIERYISHLMYEVPFPSVRRPRVLMQLEDERESISFDNYDDNQLPLSGAAFADFLKVLGPENCMYVMLLALLEQKIVIHSLRPWLLTGVAEAICSLMFPFAWQCPYIPQCPLELADVLHAPVPFIAGVDSQYFEIYDDPPEDVTSIDLDTATISLSKVDLVRKNIKPSLLPRRPAKVLRATLEKLYSEVHQQDFRFNEMRRSTVFIPIEIDYEISRQRRLLEMEVQEAFLRFNCCILKDYAHFLKPIRRMPDHTATDAHQLFNIDGFVKSRDRDREFYRQFVSTQCFCRFIEDRSLVSDQNTFHSFFDECMRKVDPSNDRLDQLTPLLSFDTASCSASSGDMTVFIPLPHPATPPDEQPVKYTYPSGMPNQLDISLFALDALSAPEGKLRRRRASEGLNAAWSMTAGCAPLTYSANWRVPPAATPAGRRTKQETKQSQAAAKKWVTQPGRWARCVLSYAYALWFTHLPSYLSQAESAEDVKRTLKLALLILLERVDKPKLPCLDEVCYRVLIQLAGAYGHPHIAVAVFMSMRRRGIQPNAVTYAIYHRAILEAEWPSIESMRAERHWSKLRHSIRAVAVMKHLVHRRQMGQGSRLTPRHHVRAHSDTPSVGTAEQLALRAVAGHDSADYGYASQSTVHSLAPATTMMPQPHPLAASLAATGAAERSSSFATMPGRTAEDSFNDSVFERSNVEYDANLDDDHSGQVLCLIDVSNDQPQQATDPLGANAPETSADLDPLHQFVQTKSTDPRHPTPSSSISAPPVRLRPSPSKVAQELLSEQHRPFDNDDYKRDETALLLAEREAAAAQSTTSVWGRAARGWLSNRLSSIQQQQQQTPDATASTSKLNRSHTALIGDLPRHVAAEAADSPHQQQQLLDDDSVSLPISPSLTSLMHSARSRVSESLSRQQPNIARLRSGVSSVVRTVMQSESLGSPLNRSRQSLAHDDDDECDGGDEMDVRLSQLDACADESLVFSLCSGDAGAVAMYDAVLGRPPTQPISEWRECVLCTCTRCAHCATLCYDEQLIAGWSPDESNLNSTCAHCDKPIVPILTTVIRRYVRNPDPPPYAESATPQVEDTPATDDVADDSDDEEVDDDDHDLIEMPYSAQRSWYIPENRVRASTYKSPSRRGQVHSLRYEGGGSIESLPSVSSATDTPHRAAAGQDAMTDSTTTATAGPAQDCTTPTTGSQRAPVNRRLFPQQQQHRRTHSTDSHAGRVQPAIAVDASGTSGGQYSPNTPRLVDESTVTHPFLSSLVVRKELENVLARDDHAISSWLPINHSKFDRFASTHPTLYWNLIYYFRRLSIPSHFFSWLLQDDMNEVMGFGADAAAQSPKDARRLIVRCVFDQSSLHDEHCYEPLYQTLMRQEQLQQSPSTDDATPTEPPPPADNRLLMWSERSMSLTVIQRIIDSLQANNLYHALQLLIEKYTKKARSSALGTPGGGMGTTTLPMHNSMYRELLFLAMHVFGRTGVRRDDFDREYANAFARLPPAVARVLPCADRVPRTAHAVCARIFMPLDVV